MSDAPKNHELLNMDAWSDGQMQSKLWLCKQIETDYSQNSTPLEIWILGSWYGLLAQMLLVREKLSIKKIQLFDIDPDVIRISEKILNTWICRREVEIIHHKMDCTQIPASLWNPKPDMVINTSTEHFHNESWFSFPKGIHFYVQSTNMDHPTHINKPENLEDFKSRLGPVTEIIHAGQLEFRYPTLQFDRYMISGIK